MFDIRFTSSANKNETKKKQKKNKKKRFSPVVRTGVPVTQHIEQLAPFRAILHSFKLSEQKSFRMDLFRSCYLQSTAKRRRKHVLGAITDEWLHVKLRLAAPHTTWAKPTTSAVQEEKCYEDK